MEIAKYKETQITLDEHTGKFRAVINGNVKRFASLQSAKNAIDKADVRKFEPVDVIYVRAEGWNPRKYKAKKIKLTKYEEYKGYRGSIRRELMTNPGEDNISISLVYGGYEVYPVEKEKEIIALINEMNQEEKKKDAAEKKMSQLDKKLKSLDILSSLDPYPEKNSKY